MMVVKPVTILRGEAYEAIPEGFGETPTKYQFTEDGEFTVTLKFPSVELVKQFSAKTRQQTEDQEAGKEPSEVSVDYDVCEIICNGNLPPADMAYPGMLTQIVMDFMSASQPTMKRLQDS